MNRPVEIGPLAELLVDVVMAQLLHHDDSVRLDLPGIKPEVYAEFRAAAEAEVAEAVKWFLGLPDGTGYDGNLPVLVNELRQVYPLEPVFVLRAADANSLPVLTLYLHHVRGKVSEEFLKQLGEQVARVAAWQRENPRRVKDSPE